MDSPTRPPSRLPGATYAPLGAPAAAPAAAAPAAPMAPPAGAVPVGEALSSPSPEIKIKFLLEDQKSGGLPNELNFC